MERSGDPATCPDGHGDTVRLLSMAGVLRGSGQSPAPASGGCCGGSCGCG
jgi:hypothetical protein